MSAKTYFSSFSETVFSVSSMGDSDLCNFLWQLPSVVDIELGIALCRGRKMRNLDSLFDEFSAALQFPYYFGENWVAFDECLSDLSWLNVRGYLICISAIDDVLADERIELRTFCKILHQVGLFWMRELAAIKGSVGPVLSPFHVLFQTKPGREIEFSKELGLLGFPAQILDMPSCSNGIFHF